MVLGACDGIDPFPATCGAGDMADLDQDGAFISIKGNCDVFGPVECDDYNPTVHGAAVEAADGVDNNCNGVIDEGVPATSVPLAPPAQTPEAPPPG